MMQNVNTLKFLLTRCCLSHKFLNGQDRQNYKEIVGEYCLELEFSPTLAVFLSRCLENSVFKSSSKSLQFYYFVNLIELISQLATQFDFYYNFSLLLNCQISLLLSLILSFQTNCFLSFLLSLLLINVKILN